MTQSVGAKSSCLTENEMKSHLVYMNLSGMSSFKNDYLLDYSILKETNALKQYKHHLAI